MIKVRMVQQMSGSRPDGRDWPPVGGEFEVTDEEAGWLFHTSDGNPHPLAVPVAEKRATETAEKRPAPEDPKVETRGEDPVTAAVPEAPGEPVTGDVPWDDEPADAPPPKRGPGRPRKDSLPK